MEDQKNCMNSQSDNQISTYDPETMFREKKVGKRTAVLGRLTGWKKGLVIFLILLAVIIVVSMIIQSCTVKSLIRGGDDSKYNFSGDYIGVLYINDVISESYDSTSYYNQSWLLDRVDQMMEDSDNKGMILDVDTPGGSVYATDELYLKLMEYKETTGRPVYTYMESQATSGGYYLAMASDKIFANRNCITGSIGVTFGTMYDVSGLMDKLGINATTINSGANKNMGDVTEPMTDEQEKIFQSLIDETFDQFVDVVAEGRGMKEAEVRKLADGRLYSAKQAEENGLIDQVGTFQEALDNMITVFGLYGCEAQNIYYEPKPTAADWLFSQADAIEEKSEYALLSELLEKNGEIAIAYMAPVIK